MNNNRQEILQKMMQLPVMIVQGDMDEAVPVTNTRMWVDTMKDMQLNYEYGTAGNQPRSGDPDGAETDLRVFGKHAKNRGRSR
jgi:hypothetical protein